MNLLSAIFLAALTVWDYPSRQFRHEQYRGQLVQAIRGKDGKSMVEVCRKGVKLLPDDPTWRYNLACALASGKNPNPALDALEKAIDLGFRDAGAIAGDKDFAPLAKNTRFQELVEYAKEMSLRPLTYGPNACVPQTSVAGISVALGEQNLKWDFEDGLFMADLKLEPCAGAYSGDLYMNRDNRHSVLKTADFPGITEVRLDSDGHSRGMDLDIPNILLPYPLFGNASRAFQEPKFWRSLPRMMLTRESWRMKAFQKLYLSNQFWVFPAHQDCPPVGKFGDVFSSICPFFLVTAGSSFTDQPYLRGALGASGALPKDTKEELVRKGLLVPALMTLIRKSLVTVSNEVDYLSVKAHPTAFPAGALDVKRLKQSAAALSVGEIPPLANVAVLAVPPEHAPDYPELTYASPFSSAFVLRSEDGKRRFRFVSKGAEEFHYSVLRGKNAAELVQSGPVADLSLDRSKMSVSNRVDIAVFGRNRGTGWGAPSYISFAVVDPSAPYSDPVLTPVGPVAK